MAKTNLKIVQEAYQRASYSDEKGRKILTGLRARLLSAAVRHVREGVIGTRGDRLREASALTGIPLNLIEVALCSG